MITSSAGTKRRCAAISEFGLKIKNIEAGTLFEYNQGVRSHYESKDSLLTNSLFCDYLKENGLKLLKNQSTKDLICLEFRYGSRSYRKELTHLQNIACAALTEYRIAKIHGDRYLMEKTAEKRKKITALLEDAHRNRKKYTPMTKEELRTLFYKNGADVTYTTYDKSGNPKKSETIHYKMLYRSTGKAKKGSCMFIRDKLYQKAVSFLYMGIRLPKETPKLVELSAYASLSASTAIGKIRIDPKNILILKDVDRFFETSVISVETDSENHCITKKVPHYRLKNTLFDGQALIDNRIFPADYSGYLLLRHHFCKMAAFRTDIQKFFRDYFGGGYETAVVTDMFGIKHAARDIELITTDNAMKWLKFGVSYESWCKKVSENGCMFGIVKTAHKSKLGQIQKMSYQMVNSLAEEDMEQIAATSAAFLERLKKDNDAFLDYLQKNRNFSNDYEALTALCRQNPDFVNCDYFRNRKKKIIETCVLRMKSGEVLQNAENLTVVGSPYAMLLYAASGQESEVDKDPSFSAEPDSIQCFTKRFDDGEFLAFFRSPFNSKNNLTYLHNVYSRELSEYFLFSEEILAVNLIGTDFQDRNNGSDQDSDFGYTTNQPDIVAYAKKCRKEYPTIVNNIPKAVNLYRNTPDSYAKIDNELAKSQLLIGASSNLAQLAQTYACSFGDEKYQDYVCILSVLAQAAIDSAKRHFDIDLTGEIARIKKEMNIKTNRYPRFFDLIKKDFNRTCQNPSLHCPMNYLYNMNLRRFRSEEKTLPISDFFVGHKLDENRVKCKKVEALIEKYSLSLFQYQTGDANDPAKDDHYLLLRSDFDDLIADIRKVYISKSYTGLISWLLNRAFAITPGVKNNHSSIKSKVNANKSLLFKVLYEVSPNEFLSCFTKKA